MLSRPFDHDRRRKMPLGRRSPCHGQIPADPSALHDCLAFQDPSYTLLTCGDPAAAILIADSARSGS